MIKCSFSGKILVLKCLQNARENFGELHKKIIKELNITKREKEHKQNLVVRFGRLGIGSS